MFIPSLNLPVNTENRTWYTVCELCEAAEKTSSVISAQKTGGVWCTYPKSIDSQATLLLKGTEAWSHTVNPYDRNLFIVWTPDGEKETQTTVHKCNPPICYGNDEIERKVIRTWCEPKSKPMMERVREEAWKDVSQVGSSSTSRFWIVL